MEVEYCSSGLLMLMSCVCYVRNQQLSTEEHLAVNSSCWYEWINS